LQDHAVGTFYLAVGLWVCHGCPIHTDVEFVAELQEFPAVNWDPLLVMMEFGTPKRWTMSVKNVIACSALRFVMGRTSTHLENLSIATNKWVKPPSAFRKGPTMSSPHTAKGHVMGMVCRT
jgi:hypothetical protein